MNQAALFRFSVCLPAVPLLLLGCGSVEMFSTAPAHGIVLCNGSPVTTGTIIFSPVPSGEEQISGRPAASAIALDGTFTLTTYKDGDGAIIGKHSVSIMIPETDEPNPPKVPCQDSTIEVEIKPGENDMKIELSE